jgi:hypothetical protein
MLFIVFSVGVPIVIASCPMAQDPHRAICTQCAPVSERQSPIFVKYVDRTCCATVIAAGRNTTEFVRSVSEQGLALSLNFILPPFEQTIINPVPVRIESPDTGPLPSLRQDIPLLVSSLLI